MEKMINVHIEKLPEGVYLATSEDVPGLVAQGRTVTEVLEIARDVARKILEARAERAKGAVSSLRAVEDSFDYPLVDVPEGTLRAILRQAGISPDQFLRKN